jgi:tRNA-dihydrouridine synthase A
MLDWTDRHYRFFARRLSSDVLLYTEMITANACIHGDRDYLLGFDPVEHPVAVQLGGDSPERLAEATRIATDYGYDEVNLNVGCPSERVQKGSFGACLMDDPDLVARIVEAMCNATHLPVTVKHRIGIPGRESYEDCLRFVDTVSRAGASRFTVHARIAILEGLSPKENRTIPPLRYDDVYRLKHDRGELEIEINGGVTSLDQIADHLKRVDGVMLGRAAYESPIILARSQNLLPTANAATVEDQAGSSERRSGSASFALPTAPSVSGAPGTSSVPGASGTSPRARAGAVTRRSVIEAMGNYVEERRREGVAPRHILRHMLHLFAGQPGSRWYRRVLSDNPEGNARRLLATAIERIPAAILDEPLG